MSRILGIVPVLGREPLAHQVFGSSPLVERAVALIEPLCTSVVVVYGEQSRDRVAPTGRVSTLSLPGEQSMLAAEVAEASQVLLHDPLCPLVPEAFMRDVTTRPADRTRVATRPVVDTVKATTGLVITRTVDREMLRVVCSPIVVAAEDLAKVGWGVDAFSDFSVMVSRLRTIGPVDLITAPSASRRVEDISELELLASIDAVSHQSRER